MSCFAVVSALAGSVTVSADDAPLSFEVQPTPLLRELSPDFCWFHPRAAAMPGLGQGGRPAVIVTLQKHLRVSDHYSGLYFMRSDDGGATWSKPTLPPELDWRKTDDGETIAVCDATPGWHGPSGRLLVIGIKLRYGPGGDQLLDRPRSHECAYATYDPRTGRWTPWRMLEVPGTDDKFFLLSPGCVQWLVRPDGSLLIPTYYRGPRGDDYSVTVLDCQFDGDRLTYRRHGSELTMVGGRGLCEPSLARLGDRYFLTLRNDARGYVTTSDNGLDFQPIKPWTFDDGTELGSYNTQQHWLVHSDGLFLAYTRRGAANDHIVRHRAPLFLAQVDPDRQVVVRRTEKVLIPERGVMLGNFGASAIDAHQSWVTDAEYLIADKPHPRGADGTVWAAKVAWSRPNALAAASSEPTVIVALGDSITKGVRTGVTAEQTFASAIERGLQADGRDVRVVNVGIGGERTDQALARLDRDILALRPRLVTIMYGTNDSYVDVGQTNSRLTAAQYRENLMTLVERLRKAGVEPLLMTEPRWGRSAKANGVGEHPNRRLEVYVDACRQVATQQKVPLVDHFRHWTDREAAGVDVGAAWTTDECHPNPEGHRVMAETILPVLRKLLAEPTAKK